MSLNKQQVTSDLVVPLFMTTYQGKVQIEQIQGGSTQLINDACGKLRYISQNFYRPFLNVCQQILETTKTNKDLCLCVGNFIKCLTKLMVDQNIIKQHGPKDYINKIQHILDNQLIPERLKQPIAFSYLKAAQHYKISFQKIIQKIAYLYRVKDTVAGIFLSRAYISCDFSYNSKAQGHYYKKVLGLELKALADIIEQYSLRQADAGQKVAKDKDWGQVEGKKQNDKDEMEGKKKRLSEKIHQILKNIHLSLVGTPFQKFQSSIYCCLQEQQAVVLVHSLQVLRDHADIMIVLREVIQKVIENIYRMRRMHKLPQLMEAISQQMHAEWINYKSSLLQKRPFVNLKNVTQKLVDRQQQASQIKILTAAFNSKIILILDDNYDVVKLLIVPLFIIRAQLFQKGQQNPKQIILSFQDACFTMKSQSLQVEFNKLTKSILSNYHVISSKVLTILDQHLLSISNLSKSVENNQDQILMLMNLVAFQISYLTTCQSFIDKVQTFLKNNYETLFNRVNPQLYFHSLLILLNYCDDMFCQNNFSQIFVTISQNLIQDRKKAQQNPILIKQFNLINHLQKDILGLFFKAGFNQEQIQKEVPLCLFQSQVIINFLRQQFDEEIILIFIQIMKNYQIQDKLTLEIFDKMLEYVTKHVISNQPSQLARNKKIYVFIKFLEQFFDIDIYKHLFQSTLSRVLSIFEVLMQQADQFLDQFFNLIKNFVNNIKYVPKNYLCWMVNFFNSSRLQSQQSFSCLAIVMRNIKKQKQNDSNMSYQLFVNCLAVQLVQILMQCSLKKGSRKYGQQGIQNESPNKFLNDKQYFVYSEKLYSSKKQIMALLCTHQLIYYHGQFLTTKVIKNMIDVALSKILPQSQQLQQIGGNMINNMRRRFSFVKGKYQLIFILLFRSRLSDVNQILLKTKYYKEVYDAIYMRENDYLMEYDTAVLIKQQIGILRMQAKQDQLQMAYANTSFLCVFYKFYILYSIRNKQFSKSQQFQYPDLESSDSDQQQIQASNQFKDKFKGTIKLVQQFPRPAEWNEGSELKQIKQFIHQLRSDRNSSQWLDILKQKCLNDNQNKLIQSLQKDLCNVNGKYRQIIKINRNPNSYSSKNQHIQQCGI